MLATQVAELRAQNERLLANMTAQQSAQPPPAPAASVAPPSAREVEEPVDARIDRRLAQALGADAKRRRVADREPGPSAHLAPQLELPVRPLTVAMRSADGESACEVERPVAPPQAPRAAPPQAVPTAEPRLPPQPDIITPAMHSSFMKAVGAGGSIKQAQSYADWAQGTCKTYSRDQWVERAKTSGLRKFPTGRQELLARMLRLHLQKQAEEGRS